MSGVPVVRGAPGGELAVEMIERPDHVVLISSEFSAVGGLYIAMANVDGASRVAADIEDADRLVAAMTDAAGRLHIVGSVVLEQSPDLPTAVDRLVSVAIEYMGTLH